MHHYQFVEPLRLIDVDHHDHDDDLRMRVSAARRDARAGRRTPSAVRSRGERSRRGRSRWGGPHGAILVFDEFAHAMGNAPACHTDTK